MVSLARAETVKINSTEFDVTRRVNYGSSAVFVADSTNLAVYAKGDATNSAQQTWLKVGDVVAAVAAGRPVSSATLTFRGGYSDTAARTLWLARTDLSVTTNISRNTSDGATGYPSAPGTSASFGAAGYLYEPRTVSIDATGAGSVDVTDWVKNYPSQAWLLTASPAATGTAVSSPAGANWNAGWHWQNALTLSGSTESPVQLAVNFADGLDLGNFAPAAGETTRYSATQNAVVGINQGRFFNRPMYINNDAAFVLVGDKPMAKFASGGTIHGKFFVGLVRGGTTKWLHNCGTVTAAYRPAHFTWLISDPAFPNLAVTLETVALTGNYGFAASASATGVQTGDKLVWAYGGATAPGGNLNTTLDPYRNTAQLTESFTPASCASNQVQILSGSLAGAFSVRVSGSSGAYTLGRCSVGNTYKLTDASAWSTPSSLIASTASTQPLLSGTVPLDSTPSVTWSFLRFTTLPTTLPSYTEPATAFASGLSRSSDLAARIVVDTPEPRLNAIASAAAAGVDGAWYSRSFRHGAMAWNNALVGWRTTFGGVMLGWHDRVKTEAQFYIGYQLTNSTNVSGSAMGLNGGKDYLLTKPAANSRFYGNGYINNEQSFYEMQTQFFDQVMHDWRWRTTDDAAYEAQLRAALELHLVRAQECYDPDNDGTYESVINTWPTDSVWFNGGGCPDETAYIYRGHLFARDLATRAGDSASVAAHNSALTKIKNAFFSQLWVSEYGHPGLYREQGGHQRLHDDPWLYSISIPIDAGLLTSEQAAEALYFTEWGLQNDRMPSGGRRVWPSNFVPAIWSARVLWPGDNYQLALSYFQAGLAADGWDVLRGTFLHSGFNNVVPGDNAVLEGGTDFGDCVHTFTRAVVEGLFGYMPDYPNGKVKIAPQFPAEWDHTSIKTPDVELDYRNASGTITLAVKLARNATLDVNLPIRASSITSAKVNGIAATWDTQSGFGCTILHLSASATANTPMQITINTSGALAQAEPVEIEGVAGSSANLSVAGATLLSFSDPEGALVNAIASGSAITGTYSTNLGYHTVFARVNVGGLPQTRIFHLNIKQPAGTPSKVLAAVPSGATWSTIDMTSKLAANVTTIYQQQYLSPRPLTISSRVGTDGYSPWTFPHWSKTKPTIQIENVASLLSGTNVLNTPQGVPFQWGGSTANIAFTSLWDNWPDLVTVPVNKAGDAAWFLICGSTTVMQGRIPNAVLRLQYADGIEEQLELIPPYNYWNLALINGQNTTDQHGDNDYTYADEAFSVPKPWPQRVQLGTNCRTMLLNYKLRPGVVLQNVTLETLSQESVVGLMGVTVMNPAATSGTLQLLSQPQSQTVELGSAAAFTVSASGTAPLSYQWFKLGVTGPVATTQTLEFPSVSTADLGTYWVVVSDSTGSIASAQASLVTPPVNQALGSTASASSTWSSGYAASYAVDGNATTRWASGPAGSTSAWLELDFGRLVSFNQLYLSEDYDRARSFNVQIWDGTAWQLLTTGTTIGTNKTINFPGVTTSKLRLNILNSTDAFTLWEIQANSVAVTEPLLLNLDRITNALQLNWPAGYLQQADTPGGAWTDVHGAVAPWSFTPPAEKGFFRVRR